MIIGLAGIMQSGKNTVCDIIQYLLSIRQYNLEEGVSLSTFKEFNQDSRNSLSGYIQRSFAYKLKQIASIITGVPIEMWENADFKKEYMDRIWWLRRNKRTEELFKSASEIYLSAEKEEILPMTYRMFLQLLGTEAMRDVIGLNTWVNALFADYKPIGWMMDERVTKARPMDSYNTYPNWIITDVRFPNELSAIYERGGVCINLTRPVEKLHKFPTESHLSETALKNAKFTYTIDNCGTIEELTEKVASVLRDLNLIS